VLLVLIVSVEIIKSFYIVFNTPASTFQDTTEKLITNGYEVSMETTSSSQSEASTPDTEQHYSVTNVDMSTTSQQELIKPGKNIHGIKTAIVQSEIVTSGRQRVSYISPAVVLFISPY